MICRWWQCWDSFQWLIDFYSSINCRKWSDPHIKSRRLLCTGRWQLNATTGHSCLLKNERNRSKSQRGYKLPINWMMIAGRGEMKVQAADVFPVSVINYRIMYVDQMRIEEPKGDGKKWQRPCSICWRITGWVHTHSREQNRASPLLLGRYNFGDVRV